MTTTSTRFELARVQLQFDTPFRVGAGGWDPLVDAFFATDANGLPALPGTSIAGVMRHAARAAWGERETAAVFGFQRGNEGRASRVRVSWGQVHDAQDRPVPFWGANLAGDDVLVALAAGVVRDHVRIGPRGTVDGTGKFDEQVVLAGARFTFELLLDAGSGRSMVELLGLLASPTVRLGAGSRKGLGRFHVNAVGRSFDLANASDREAFARLPVGLHEPVPAGLLQPLEGVEAPTSRRWVTGTLTLEPVDFWMVGGGDPWREDAHRRSQRGEEAWIDMVPVEMAEITWSGGAGRVAPPRPVVPGSSLKGVLRHRVAFHARRLAHRYCDPEQDVDLAAEEVVEEVDALFGSIKTGDEGRPGRILLADGRVDGERRGRLDHVSLDRFTQGPLDRALFSEAPLFGGLVQFDLALDLGADTGAVDHRGDREDGVSDRALAALRHALDDLCAERLPIGAGANRGHGYCRGRISWKDGNTPWTT